MAKDRRRWAEMIIGAQLPVVNLLPLLEQDEKTANRTLMLISELGMQDPKFLQQAMPELLKVSADSRYPGLYEYMVKYWYYAGVPEEQEGDALDRAFEVLLRPEVKIHVKTPAFHVARKLVNKYPELRMEFISILEDQLGKVSGAFDHRSIQYITAHKKV